MDTGADVKEVSKVIQNFQIENFYLDWFMSVPEEKNMEIAGIIHVKLKNKSFSYEDEVYVINNLQQSLLSCIASLNLIHGKFELKSKLDTVKKIA